MHLSNELLPSEVKQAARDLNSVLRDLERHVVAQEQLIRVVGIALVSGANIFLWGSPGISKTMIARLLAERFNGKFHRALYGPYLEPEAIFGGQDLDEFMKGNYVRHREGTILDCNLHFADEILEANDAMRKSMLGLLDEVPSYSERGSTEYLENLLLFIAASNKLFGPEDAAFGDRFVLQVPVSKPPEREDRLEILQRHDSTHRGHLSVEPQAYVSLGQIKLLRAFARANIAVPQGILEKLVSLDDEVTEKIGVYVSPRTLNRCLDILKATALLAGRTEVTQKDFWVLQFVIAPIPQQDKAREVILDLTAPLEREALAIVGDMAKEVGEWRALAKGPSKTKKAQAKKGGQDLLNSVLNYKVELQVRAERAEKEGYDAEAIINLVAQVDQQIAKIQETIGQLYSNSEID